ncbi:dinucleotide-utilizing enzyme [Microbacterium pumilum]|uniref:Dinucleotide-utilizing enzyme n=1 Tax=Microbacterium pumilum TaxID=344165 RepID=A0ABN2SJY8_9MICO
MNTRPSLLRSIPFWILVAASLVSVVLGAWIFSMRLGQMTATLTDGSATAVDVYVGPSVALFGTVLVGAGVIGLLLALAVAAASSLRPKAPVEVVEPIGWTDEEEIVEVVTVPAAPVADAEPVATEAEVPVGR